MGYFSNGTEADIYEHQYCVRCIHYPENIEDMCPVWTIHFIYSHDQYENRELMDAMNRLIPNGKIKLPDGREIPGNLQCNMFVEVKDAV